jgi:Domain of unknown function (DUF4388)
MTEERQDLVRIDATGAVHPVGKVASRRLRARQGSFQLLPAPAHLVVMRDAGEEGQHEALCGPAFRLAGEIMGPGALCDIVSLIGQAGWRGELVILDDAASRSLFFEHGHVVGARSSIEADRIGEVLYRYGTLSREQIAETLAAAAPEARFGEVAVRLGFATREQLYQMLGNQAEEIVYRVLLAGEGMFYFLESFDEEQIASRQNLPVQELLMEAVRRMDEMRYFRERIPSDQHVPARIPERVPPPPELRAVYDAIDGQRSVAEIARAIGQGEFEATRALFQLVRSGRVVVQAPRPTGLAGSVALFNEAIAMIFAAVDAAQHGDEVRAQLASFASGAGIYDTLFRGAGPALDGRVSIERLVENATLLAGPAQAEVMLSQWLYEYVSFAMFVAEPYLRSGHDGTPGSKRSDGQPPLSRRVAELVGPLAPK